MALCVLFCAVMLLILSRYARGQEPPSPRRPGLTQERIDGSQDWQLLEFVCAENDRNPVDAGGNTGFTRE